MTYLILVRHGISEWNKLGLWTGWKDVKLSPEGYDEAKRAAESIRDVKIDKAFTADLIRTTETTKTILETLGIPELEVVITPALRERNYGELAGQNKWEVKEKYGDEQFMKWRRGWDEPIPGGESLKDVYDRMLPYYQEHVEPELKSGKNILVSASGNSLRALVKYLESISDGGVAELEIGTGEVYVYELDENLKILSKEIRSTNEKKGKV